ncbi:DUF1573 domain-containing protein [Spongiivirga sp. MCCC 1A20706]|uniref:DUF1573 domain-containing protein n=1 Tax=Spongiivirga sp. MCCC 1A20706 TaxID=3160963 RepID=UPI0039778396
MKKYVAFMLIAFVAFAATAQEKMAKIEFKTEVIDYGEIAKGSDGLRTFEFTNTGNAPLVVTKVISSCGCTIPKKPEEPIAPGDTGIIEVKYNTQKVGPIRRTITVLSNADEPTKALKIKGKVLAAEGAANKS